MRYFSIEFMQISNAFTFIYLGMEFKGYKPKYIETIIQILMLYLTLLFTKNHLWMNVRYARHLPHDLEENGITI